ncbi:MAG TPA: restriction endonuclease [Anaerolineae bacterium]|nr:restriction endonuclease [Anaerolineae bacterium]HQH39129.1 restriction endonuclease [Anaerolineae bacterium]
MFKRQLELLLMMFDDLSKLDDPQRRGFLLEDLLPRIFDLFSIPVIGSFRRNSGAEQIDGSFRLEGWHYLVECKWQEKLSDIRQLDSLYGKIARSGKQAMGMFLSINGWSSSVPSLLKQNPDKCIILMDGYDLRCVLSGQIDLQDFLLAKVGKLNDEGEPFLSAQQYLQE